MSEIKWPEPSMMLKTSPWGPTQSFSLMPINNDCPFVECLYNPAEKLLAIIGKTKKDTFHMVARIDSNGHPESLKVGATPENKHKKQRVSQESYTEYYINEKDEVIDFIKKFAINHEEFDYMKTLDKETMSAPDTVATGPQLIIQK